MWWLYFTDISDFHILEWLKCSDDNHLLNRKWSTLIFHDSFIIDSENYIAYPFVRLGDTIGVPLRKIFDVHSMFLSSVKNTWHFNWNSFLLHFKPSGSLASIWRKWLCYIFGIPPSHGQQCCLVVTITALSKRGWSLSKLLIWLPNAAEILDILNIL